MGLSYVAIVKYLGTHAVAVSLLELPDELHFGVTTVMAVNKAADETDDDSTGGMLMHCKE